MRPQTSRDLELQQLPQAEPGWGLEPYSMPGGMQRSTVKTSFSDPTQKCPDDPNLKVGVGDRAGLGHDVTLAVCNLTC